MKILWYDLVPFSSSYIKRFEKLKHKTTDDVDRLNSFILLHLIVSINIIILLSGVVTFIAFKHFH